MKKILAVLIFFSLFLVASFNLSFAQERSILGDNTQQLNVPPTVEGPGYILPDSPFYFLDLLKQQVRLFLATTLIQKAQVYDSIAGERIAEMRFELIKDNKSAAYTAISGMKDATMQEAIALGDARLAGFNVFGLAENINLNIKRHQQILDALQAQITSGEMYTQIVIAQASLSNSKTVVEQSLPKDLLEKEIAEDTNRNMSFSANVTAAYAQELKTSIDALLAQATMASQKNMSSSEKQKKDLTLALEKDAQIQVGQIIEKAQGILKTIETIKQINSL